MATRNEVEQAISQELNRLGGYEVEETTPDSKLKEDLGMDSLDVVELSMECEKIWQIRIGEEAEEQLQHEDATIKHLVDMVCDWLNIVA